MLNQPRLLHDAEALTKVKRVLRDVRTDRERTRKEEGNLEEEVEWRRQKLAEEYSEADAEALDRAEKRVKERALQEAREWRTRSRVKWLSEDDAPSKYFFSKLRAKWSRESIEVLEGPDGEELTEREDILGEIHEFYQTLYTAEEESVDRGRTREEVLQLIQKRLTEEESRNMSRTPGKEEIEEIVFKMAANKSPGAKVNLSKSLVMPLGKSEVPPWAYDIV
ncbi:hypothetical protein R1sor_002720 [Riccia sorocarpa]|uniref:Uncharacterized protein n=1 Tax=Riccia sorocarpa TaxID=122646 RepID=A0ABD3H0D5_9MARC